LSELGRVLFELVTDVRFGPNCGRLRVGKENLHGGSPSIES
jgi:hypothetical protein